MLEIGNLAGCFNVGDIFRGISFRLGDNRRVKLMKTGNTKGAALLGYVVKERRASQKAVGADSNTMVNCLHRSFSCTNRAVHSRVRRT